MAKLKVVVSDYIEPNLDWETDQFAQMGVDFSAYQLKNAPIAELLKVVADADVVIVNMARINEELLDGLERTRLIIRHGVGYDNIDVAAACRLGMVVSYMPDYCMHEVAEQAVMLILACQRKLNQQIHLDRRIERDRQVGFLTGLSDLSPCVRKPLELSAADGSEAWSMQ